MTDQYWSVTDAEGETQFIHLPKGAQPTDHGYPVDLFTAKKLPRAPREDEEFVQNKLRVREKIDSDMDKLIDARLRHHGLIP